MRKNFINNTRTVQSVHMVKYANSTKCTHGKIREQYKVYTHGKIHEQYKVYTHGKIFTVCGYGRKAGK